MASSILSRVFHKFSGGIRIPPRCAISRCCWSKVGGEDTPPWLMLPPAAGNVYQFYSLADGKVLSIKRESKDESPVECVGSSHGWIALFDRRKGYDDHDLFLWNPLSGRHIQLPSMEDPGKWGLSAKVLKLVVSESDEGGCRAMMIYGPLNRLAHCSPGDPSCDEWTQVGRRSPYGEVIHRKCSGGNVQLHEDLVYCKRHKRFITIDAFEKLDLDSHRLSCFVTFYIWDPWDPPVDGALGDCFHYNSEKETTATNSTVSWVKDNMALLKHKCLQIPHILHVDSSDRVYLVFQFVMPDDLTTSQDLILNSRFDCYSTADYPSKTVGFVVLRLKADGEDYDQIVDDLDGLAMFVGINNSFALPASDFPELKPDSIYFTDARRIASIHGRNDFGIFDYRNKTIHEIDIFQGDDYKDMDCRSSSPGTKQVKRLSPMWFTPA